MTAKQTATKRTAAKKDATQKTTTSSTKVSEKQNDSIDPVITVKTVKCNPSPALNIRDTPSSDGNIVGEYKDGTEIAVVEACELCDKSEDDYVVADYLV